MTQKILKADGGTAGGDRVAVPVAAQDDAVTVVLSEELDVVEPCMASRSNIGRVILQNVSETMTELVPGEGLQPRLAESWEDMGDGTWRFHLREGVDVPRRQRLRRRRTWRIRWRGSSPTADRLRDRRQVLRRHGR